MMAAVNMDTASPLLARLPKTYGKQQANAPLKNLTWFKVGGSAEVLFEPGDENDLSVFLKKLPADIPVTMLGLASNVIVRDGGIPGVTIRLGTAFRFTKGDNSIVTVGAAVPDVQLARRMAELDLTGLEFMSGIPGSIGGGLRMNAGAYGSEFKDVLIDCRAMDRSGEIHTLTNAEMGFSYRHCNAPEDWIFIDARFKVQPGNYEAIANKMADIQKSRTDSQPIRTYTGGSTFANPEGGKAWKLIDEAGCRGLKIGGAQVSEQHCNFLINTGTATATDLETLGETVRQKVKEKSGVELRWEIKRLGKTTNENPA